MKSNTYGYSKVLSTLFLTMISFSMTASAESTITKCGIEYRTSYRRVTDTSGVVYCAVTKDNKKIPGSLSSADGFIPDQCHLQQLQKAYQQSLRPARQLVNARKVRAYKKLVAIRSTLCDKKGTSDHQLPHNNVNQSKIPNSSSFPTRLTTCWAEGKAYSCIPNYTNICLPLPIIPCFRLPDTCIAIPAAGIGSAHSQEEAERIATADCKKDSKHGFSESCHVIHCATF